MVRKGPRQIGWNRQRLWMAGWRVCTCLQSFFKMQIPWRFHLQIFSFCRSRWDPGICLFIKPHRRPQGRQSWVTLWGTLGSECCSRVILPLAILIPDATPNNSINILDGIKYFTFIKTMICNWLYRKCGSCLGYSWSSSALFSFNICALSSISQDWSKLYFY